MDLSTRHAVVSLLAWDENESQNCTAQGLITNDTDHVWLSCKSYIAHGRLAFASSAASLNSAPVRLVLDRFNYRALDGPLAATGQAYGHISDGDYFPGDGKSRTGEVWFGIEGDEQPRVIPGAIARYNAETLEFIDIHPHPYIRTMPWLLVDPKRQRAISGNWTDNFNQFNIFDAQTLTWVQERNLTLSGVPVALERNGVPYIQGATKMPSLFTNDEFIIQVDDAQSTILLISFSRNDETSLQVQYSWQTGLGQEREGIGMTAGHILSLGNRKSSVPWSLGHDAQIVVIEVLPSLTETSIPFGFGILIGMGLVLCLRTLCWCCCCWCRKKSKGTYTESEMTTLNYQSNGEDSTENELI